MGIDKTAAKMLMLLKNESGIDLSQTVILGRQHNYIGPILRRKIQKSLGLSKSSLKLSSKYCDDFLSALGMDNLEILDISDYEGATILHDLNFPISPLLQNKFLTVIDIGTSEHIYDITQALRNLKNLCALNGHVLMISPANSWLGHGFYQFSPELFFRTFDSESGFEILNLFLIKHKVTGDVWYELTDPKSMGRRGTILTKGRCTIAVLAHKVLSEDIHVMPQQSDYEPAWQTSNVSKLGSWFLGLPWTLRRGIEITVLPLKHRYENRLSEVKFSWIEDRLTIRKK